MGKISIDDFIFSHMGEESNDRTRKRLNELNDMGCEEIGIASFGVKGVFSGVYIEKVWNNSDEDWESYLNWMKEMIQENKEKWQNQ